jgi:predicted  nucleic acid-binding Zn-ribbon protein
MNSTAGGLKDLHELHLRLQSVQEELLRGPKQIEARRQFAERKQTELEALRGQIKKLKMATDQKTLQLRSNESKISELKVRLNAASSNREFDIIKGQIDADTMANSVLEDEILEALEKVDQATSAVAAAETEFQKAVAEQKRIESEVAQGRPGLEHQAGEVRSALANAEKLLPATIYEGYRRLVQAHGAGALASVRNKACTACNAILAPQNLVDIRTGKIITCRSCGRMLYRDDSES